MSLADKIASRLTGLVDVLLLLRLRLSLCDGPVCISCFHCFWVHEFWGLGVFQVALDVVQIDFRVSVEHAFVRDFTFISTSPERAM